MKKITLSATVIALVAAACAPVDNKTDGGVSVSLIGKDATAYKVGDNQARVVTRRSDNENSIPADCKITSSKFETASFRTPVKVNLPAYSQGAVPLTLTCTYNGETQTAEYQPDNLSAAARAGSAFGVALLCPICGLGVAAANVGRERSNDIYGYQTILMTFDF